MRKEKETMVVQKFNGSKFWLWFWIILALPIGVVYYFVKREPVRVKVRSE